MSKKIPAQYHLYLNDILESTRGEGRVVSVVLC